MRIGVLARVLLAAAALAAGCTPLGNNDLSPSVIALELQPARLAYSPTDTFSGTVQFTNKTIRSISAQFPTQGQYLIGFYDTIGVLRLYDFPGGSAPTVSWLSLGPHGTRVDTFAFPFAARGETIPEGVYQACAWVAGHDDICCETTISVWKTQH